MKLTIFVLFGCALCWGGVAGDCTPSSLNIPGAPYPCVHPDRRVTFRVAAPDAQKVQVRLGGAHDMTPARTACGWSRYRRRSSDSITTASWWTALSWRTRRRGRSSARGGTTAGSRFPSRTPTRPTTRQETFRTAKCASAGTTQRSRANGGAVRIHAAGLRGQLAKPLPGALSAARLGRERAGLAHPGPRRIFIMDNLIAEKKAKPMIIVMDNLNAVQPARMRRCSGPRHHCPAVHGRCAAADRRPRPAAPARAGGGRFPANWCSTFHRDDAGRSHPYGGANLPRRARPREPRDGRTLDGRHAVVPDRPRAPDKFAYLGGFSGSSGGRGGFDPKTANNGVFGTPQRSTRR